jgi:hypothetical protein
MVEPSKSRRREFPWGTADGKVPGDFMSKADSSEALTTQCKPLRILFTNWNMIGRHGSVMYIRDLAWGLFLRGQRPVVYAPELGEVADELKQATIPVVDNLQQITAAPDIIIGNSNTDVMEALLHFTETPAIFVCHAWDIWLCYPPRFPRLRRCVAVDETLRDWLVSMRGIPDEEIRLIYNAVDLDRFLPRQPLPQRPARAAVFSNYMNEGTGLGVIREACRRADITLEVLGSAGGRAVPRPEEVLGHYDLVFGKARCALEAMATGCAVISCDYGKLGGMVTSQNWTDLRSANFGRRSIQKSLDVDHLLFEISKYDAADAREVSRQTRALAGLEGATAELLELCREVVEEQSTRRPDVTAELRAAADYLRNMNLFADTLRLRDQIGRQTKETELLQADTKKSQDHLARLAVENQLLQEDTKKSQDHLARLAVENQALREETERLRQSFQRDRSAMETRVKNLEYELLSIHNAPAWRLLSRLRILTKLYRLLASRLSRSKL